MTDIDQFLDKLWLQQGVSQQTLAAYRSDLQHFQQWLEKQSGTLAQASSDDITSYLGVRRELGLKARSQARLLSSLRKYYGYLLRTKQRNDDPTAHLNSPKLPAS